jgi:hypothetical protein
LFISGYTDGALVGSNQGLGDAWVAKYSSAGKLLWKRQLGSPRADYPEGVATDHNGNVFISGYTRGNLVGDNDNERSPDAWVAKYSPGGVLLWTQQLGTRYFGVYAFCVATDRSGNVFISGSTDAALAGSNTEGVDAWVAKYSSAGVLLWIKKLNFATYDFSFGVTTDSSGNVFISGDTKDKFGAKNYDAWIAKYSSDGVLKWQQKLGSSRDDSSNGVATANSGDVFISGFTKGALAGNNKGDGDAWVAKYSTFGALKWVRQVGTSERDSSEGVATDGSGNVLISGYTGGNFLED